MPELPELTNEQWQEYLERLTLYTVKKFRYLGWVAKGGDRTGPRGKSPQDVAYEAVLKALNGERQYNREAYSDFGHFLRSAVDSLIYQLAKSFEGKKFKPMPVATSDQEDREEIEFEGKEATPAKICVNKEIAEKVKGILSQEVKDDPVVNGILECFEAGITKPAEMAEVLGIDVKDIYTAKKRLQRVIDKKLQPLKMEYHR